MFAVSVQALGRLIGKEAAKMAPNATANIKGFDGRNIHGLVGFYKNSHGLLIMGEITGLEPSETYAIHIHEYGSCDSPKAPGGHFDPKDGGGKHGEPNCGPNCHAGDLPNITAGATGTASINYTSKVLTADDSKFSVTGRSIVIHNRKDNHSGEAIACGLIQPLP